MSGLIEISPSLSQLDLSPHPPFARARTERLTKLDQDKRDRVWGFAFIL